MKFIIKIRNFDSLKKLNHKRANGKKKNINTMIKINHQTFIHLHKMHLLDIDLISDLSEINKILNVEKCKLDYVIDCRNKKIPLSEENMEKYVYEHSISLYILHIPFEIRHNKIYEQLIYQRFLNK